MGRNPPQLSIPPRSTSPLLNHVTPKGNSKKIKREHHEKASKASLHSAPPDPILYRSSRPSPPPGVPAPFSSSEAAAIFRPPSDRCCVSAAARYPALQPEPPPQARPREGGPGLSVRGRQLQRHEGPAQTPPAVPGGRELALPGENRQAARGPDRLHWAERP